MQYPIIDNLIYAYLKNGWTGLELTEGKNLLRFPYYITGSGILHGVNYNVNDDGSIDLYGTSNDLTYIDLIKATNPITLKPGEYIINGNPQNTQIICGRASDNVKIGGTDVNNGRFTITTETDVFVFILIQSGYNINGIAYPMIRKASDTPSFEPYAPPTTDIDKRLKLPMIHYFPHPVIDALISAADGQHTEEEKQILRHYLTPLGIGGI